MNNFDIKKKAWNICFIICHQHQIRSEKVKTNETQQMLVTKQVFFWKNWTKQLLVNDFILLLKSSKLFVKIEVSVATGIKFFNIRSLWTLWNMVLRYHILLRNIKFDATIKTYVFIFHVFTFLSGTIVCNRILHESIFIELCPTVVVLNVFFRPMPNHNHYITSFQTSLIQYQKLL